MADFTIAAQVKPPQIDPLAVAGNAMALQKSVLGNKLLGMNIQQQKAQMDAAQGAVDPATGQFDPNHYMTSVAAGGGSSSDISSALDMQIKGIQKAAAAQGLTQEQMKTSSQEAGNIALAGQGLIATISRNPAMGTADFIRKQFTDNVINPGLVKTPEALDRLNQELGQLTDDPAHNLQVLQNGVALAVPIAKAFGETTTVNTGDKVQAVQINPANLDVAKGGSVNMGLPPGESVSPGITTTDQDTGKQHIFTKGELLKAQQEGRPPVGITSGMSVGDQANVGPGTAFQGSLGKAASQWGDVHATLANFRGLVESGATGPKAGTLKVMGQLAAQFGIAPPAIKGETATLEEMGKLAQQIAQRQFQQLGGTGTDAKLDSAMHTSPTEFLSKEGNKRIIPLLQGNNDAIKAEQDAYQVWAKAHGPQDYNDFIRDWNKHYDPRVFQAAYMPAADVAAMKAGMTKAERANFDAFSAFAKSRNWLNGG